jgi:hypothetical protein
MARIDLSALTPVAETRGETPEETEAIQALAKRAESYLLSHSWCVGVQKQFTALAFPRVFGLFLFQIVPSRTDVDQWLWVLTGDIPPAYLVTDDATDPQSAIELYEDLMQEWVDAVLAGEPTDELIPVNAPASPEFAEMLRSRLQFIRETIIPWMHDDD